MALSLTVAPKVAVFEQKCATQKENQTADKMIKTENEQNCEMCGYWHNPEKGTFGWCRRYAPAASLTTYHTGLPKWVEWPAVLADDWCGDFTSKAAVRSTQAA